MILWLESPLFQGEAEASLFHFGPVVARVRQLRHSMRMSQLQTFGIFVGFFVVTSGARAFEVATEFKDISRIPHVKIDLRYASSNNFMHEDLYGDFRKAYLHETPYAKLEQASRDLQAAKPGFQLIVFDALRPRHVQRKLFAHVKGTPQEPYVANPDQGSVHNYGFAVDLSIVDEKGKELDMGTPFDDFTPLAEPRLQDKFLKEGRLTPAQIANREILRTVMEGAGFKRLPNEWWHFDALPIEELKKKYKIVE